MTIIAVAFAVSALWLFLCALASRSTALSAARPRLWLALQLLLRHVWTLANGARPAKTAQESPLLHLVNIKM
jgi:hypothetical protein